MNLTVVFEHWHLGDGTYPAFAVGDEVRLSFEITPRIVDRVGGVTSPHVRHIADAEYEIVADVIRIYDDGISGRFPVLQADWFRFYCPGMRSVTYALGDRLRLRGSLCLDHYMWVEFLDRYEDPPDLFYGARIERIRQVAIGAAFVRRSGSTMSHPTKLRPGEYNADAVIEVARVADESDGPAFSLLDLVLLPAGEGPREPSFIDA